MSDITIKSLDSIGWADIQDLIQDQIDESQYLEFKSGELCKPSNSKESVRDTACKSIVAFANAYGGTFVLGVDEAGGIASGTAHQINDIAVFAENFERSVRSMIEPPIAGLQFKAIGSGDGSGVLLIRTPASVVAPHGFATPTKSYVRVGKNSRPMTMRDLQSLFWDARTRRERVTAIRASFCSDFEKLRHEFRKGELREQNGKVVSASESRMFFRVSAIAQERLSVRPMPLDPWRHSLRPSNHEFNINEDAVFDDGPFEKSLRPIAHGVAAVGANCRWIISDDGTATVIGSRGGASSQNNQNQHYPNRYVAVIAQVLVMADRVRRAAGMADTTYEVDCEIAAANEVYANLKNDYGSGGQHRPILDYGKVGPFLMESRDTFQSTLSALEAEIWAFFGLTPPKPMEVNWHAAWQKDASV
jgi:hypothetical protein